MSNLLEFVFGGDPLFRVDQDRLPRVSINGPELEFRYLRHPAAADFVIVPEASFDLLTWRPLVPGSEGVTLTIQTPVPADGIDQITIRTPMPASGPYFMRLNVSSP